jgi:RNA-directed DNA polymerase
MGKQKTASAGAPKSLKKKEDVACWNGVDWTAERKKVRRLQMRIAKATQQGRWNKVKSLQYLLTRSRAAKLLAVKRVTTNKGKKTPGIDGVLWKGAKTKWQAVNSLHKRGYRPQPLRRTYISKKRSKKKRPLSIPTMYDRAMQALYKLALAPIAETTADRNSYGFREGRSCADAVGAAFNALNKPNSAMWVLEADIEGCFDNISHKWMLENIPMDKEVLAKWLKAGYVEKGIRYPTRRGTPQGGIISPTLMNMVLDGLEEAVRKSVPRRSRVNFIRYADDFIITGKSRRLLEKQVKPAVVEFLRERGLNLSEEKTAITHIRDSFMFLGQTFRKHGKVLHIRPSKEGVESLIQRLGGIIRKYVSAPMPLMIKKLNSVLRGWGNYHRHVVAGASFYRIDGYVHDQLCRMLRKRHPRKSKKWLVKKYWMACGKEWVFSAISKTKLGNKVYSVVRLGRLGIKRHIKVKADANPYLKEYAGYFWQRRHNKEKRLLPALTAKANRAILYSN